MGREIKINFKSDFYNNALNTVKTIVTIASEALQAVLAVQELEARIEDLESELNEMRLFPVEGVKYDRPTEADQEESQSLSEPPTFDQEGRVPGCMDEGDLL